VLKIKEGTVFIADSHYPHHGDAFLTLLKRLEHKELQTSQLFLMGDNFDLLFGYNTYIKTFSQEAIALLNTLSKTMEIHYFEGNHDFCLKDIFPDIQVYSREEQPKYFLLNEKKVALSHGDKYAVGIGYNFYTTLLRNRITLKLFSPIGKLIIDDRMKKLSHKNICRPFNGFEKRVNKIMKYYQGVDMAIEGHFHQGKMFGKYLSLPSLACQGSVGVVKEGSVKFMPWEQL